MATATRKRDGDERRRALCDAAIQVLAEHGSRGLTHGQVDRYAGVPEGTTSYYYRTRTALLRGVSKRVAEIDVTNLQSVIDEPLDPLSPFAHLARLTMFQADGPGLMLNRARHELLLGAARDPDLAETSQVFVTRVNRMTRDAIAHLQPGNDPALLAAQTAAVTTFIAGVFTRLAAGDRTIYDAEQLTHLLQAVATAVSLQQT
ncbi:MAG: TetR family transcriptional regulator [Mycobacterium sp.]|uniref:TetR/AcrR family transcriptional regulator n=1 Tax=Mycobacterium sp. TaxID=1785 RepID=UPI001EC6684C|nr:TetR family transcriptional regulator [Mycobacterium sp.]MBV8789358.1 TetR family transcriptional regulator [Mycobacterium sp.]